ncbi:MAG TPA: ABC transporter permease [Planctomycetota bacterium]|nr:ABC transporter permease [Planctomycetota bacterium]
MKLAATVWELTRKDLLLYSRDRTALALGFLLPIALVTIFGFVMGHMGGGGDALPAIDVAVVDEDGSAASAALVAALRGSEMLDARFPKPGKDGAPGHWTREDALGFVRNGDRPAALVIPAGYGAGAARLEVLADPGRGMEKRLLDVALLRALFQAGGSGSALPDMDAMLQQMLPVTRTDVAPEGRDRQMSFQISHAVSGMTVMMLLFSLVGFSRSLLEERAQGTLRRLLAAPIDPRALLLSKLASSMIIGMALIAVLFTFATFAFHLDVLSRWDTLLVASVATALACTAFALAIAGWAATDKQADGVSTLLILVMAPLGGCWIPLMVLPPVVRMVAQFTLPYWSLTTFLGSFWYGQHWTEPPMLKSLGVLLAIAAALFWLATVLFRRRYLAA